ncbi:IDEAL domain-containing protein [Paenibacillus sp. IB182496]|uniref:IDEAL domain-containing protein n=1 Tax=Paenibacillus sabuli TaxID=2772509 RepID=A0A927BQ48_9BACL|nr:IDEAL domain-containing protein [Paenibacillus sabuli]MBD2844207.1 IDEAL domain-containing protein [Paenibacillus sabuli]
MTVQIGDWVQGHTSQGELVHGYVESFVYGSGVKVAVVHSDHDEAIGHSASLRAGKYKALPESGLEDAQACKSLIDLALATRDEAWFAELTDRLRGMAAPAAPETEADRRISYTNRLGQYR